MISTSYFPKYKKVENPVGIVVRPPQYYRGPNCIELAPPINLVMEYKSGNISADDYTRDYYRLVLLQNTPQELFHNLHNKFGSNITLLCFEKPGEFCHRRLIAEYLEKGLNIVIPELNF